MSILFIALTTLLGHLCLANANEQLSNPIQSDTSRADFEESVEEQLEKYSRQKKALMEMYAELTEEQKAALDEEFQSEVDRLSRKIEQLSQQIRDKKKPLLDQSKE